MNEYTKACHCVHRLTYHLVFVTKYRKPVISDAIGEFLCYDAARLFEMKKGGVISAETDRDHMHLLVWLPPNCNLSDVVRSVKTQLSREVHTYYKDEIEQYLRGDCPFWTPSYFAATTGSVSMETVKAYIESQRTEEHQLKSNKRKAT